MKKKNRDKLAIWLRIGALLLAIIMVLGIIINSIMS